MSEFYPFLAERVMSKYEQDVDYNLSESGVHPLSLNELLSDNPDYINELLDTNLNYPHVNGIPELRENIAALYDGATPDNVLVTVGAIEANYVSTRTLLDPGDEIVVMVPNYLQIWGVAKNHGNDVREVHLRDDNGWALDLEGLREAVSEKTKVIAVCNPNNPTGHILTEVEMDAIVAEAERVGAWLIADEVYRGAERMTDDETPSFFGRYDKVLAVGSMSKAYGLPGLRIGWVVGPVETIDDIWARHEYTTICATMLSNKLAALALSPEVRPRIIQRTRNYIRQGHSVLEKWAKNHDHIISLSETQAAAIAFLRYKFDINSAVLTERLMKEKSVFIVPGDYFGQDGYVRISFGLPEDYLSPALDRIHDFLSEFKP